MCKGVVSNTAASRARLINRRSLSSKPRASFLPKWCWFMYRPSLQARPVRCPDKWSNQATSCASCVVCSVPTMPITGMRPESFGPNKWSTTALPTGRGWPTAGFTCMSRPGPALTSITAPRVSCKGRPMSSVTISMPAMSRPITRAASVADAATSGCTLSVTSRLRLPLRCTTTERSFSTTLCGSSPWR